MFNRRQFLQTSLAAGAGACLVPQFMSSSEAATAKSRMGLMVSTVGELMQQDMAGTLKTIARVGYKEVELGYSKNRKPEEIKAMLDAAGLTCPSGLFIYTNDIKAPGDLDKVIHEAQVIGKKYLVNVWTPAKTLDDFKRTAELFNQTGEKLRQAGLKLCHHNHDFELIPVDGQVPLEVLLQNTDPANFNVEMDLYWVANGGGNIMDLFNRYPGRFPLWHVKDMDGSTEKRQIEIGRGVINFKEIFANAKKAGMQHFFIEQEAYGPNKLNSIRISYDYVSKLKLG